ncbi:hypothetical protein SASPL_134075 [Salvia splendens]|uniref:Uncharacterized protein n=1 Tax=Salvia splendens TaxID=180675 RepID=A0A8X8X699_SALSN|nr:hypothetical protein SASPL_134075 [Salvia splendens]
MLYIIGLGLGDEKDITLRGLIAYALPVSLIGMLQFADIKVKEPSLESLCRGKKVYEPPRFMTINTAIEQLLEVAQNHPDSAYNKDTTCVGLVRVGCEDQMIAAGSMEQLLTIDFGPLCTAL